MLLFKEAAAATFTEINGRYVFYFGPEIKAGGAGGAPPRDTPQFQLELEPLLTGGYVLALYENKLGSEYPELLFPEKVPVIPMTPLLYALLASPFGGK